ncbi:nitrogen regulatory protein PII [Dysgonomonadaceae bacterium PH5-43]|nr:nitrogen regulatory protein PII [Dysgonomonadaceae bacterium PH5-43]
MKAVFIPFNQANKARLVEILDRMSIRGFTMWEEVQGRGTNGGQPHYGDHAWPTLNSSILAVIPDEKVDSLLQKIHELDKEAEMLGIHAFVWNVETFV